MAGTSLTFDGNNLQTENIITQDIDHHSGPTKSSQMYSIAHANFSVIPFINYPSKTVTVTGELSADSVSDLDTLIDTFKGYFTTQDKNLDIGYAGGTRRYICTPESPQITRPGGLMHAEFTVVFDCTFPFGRNTSTTTALDDTGRTLSVYADSHTFLGTAPFQYVIATFTYSAISGATAKAVSFGNNANGQKVTVTRDWAAGDVLQINMLSKTDPVTVNGTSVDFTGGLPIFPNGSQAMGYSDGFTSRTFDVNIVYYPMWM